ATRAARSLSASSPSPTSGRKQGRTTFSAVNRALTPISEFFSRQRGAGGQGAKFLQCNISVHRRHAAVGAREQVLGGHVLQGLFYNVRDLFSRFNAIGRYVDDADQHVLALQQLQQLDRHLRMDALERDLRDAPLRQGREDLRV